MDSKIYKQGNLIYSPSGDMHYFWHRRGYTGITNCIQIHIIEEECDSVPLGKQPKTRELTINEFYKIISKWYAFRSDYYFGDGLHDDYANTSAVTDIPIIGIDKKNPNPMYHAFACEVSYAGKSLIRCYNLWTAGCELIFHRPGWDTKSNYIKSDKRYKRADECLREYVNHPNYQANPLLYPFLEFEL
jgi:hypothetical protein